MRRFACLAALVLFGCTGSGPTDKSSSAAGNENASGDSADRDPADEVGDDREGTLPTKDSGAADSDAADSEGAPAIDGAVETGSPSCAAAPSGWRSMASAGVGNVSWYYASWSGSEMLIAGQGTTCVTGSCATKWYARAYDPKTDGWRVLPEPPLAGFGSMPRTLFGGGLWIFFAASRDPAATNGYTFDPATNVWATIEAPPFSARSGVATVYAPSTGELVAFGGVTPGDDGLEVDHKDGAAWSSSTRTWRKIADAPFAAGAVTPTFWDDHRVLVLFPSSSHHSEGSFADLLAASYDPKTDVWTSLPRPTGKPRVGSIYDMVGSFAIVYRGFPSLEDGDYPDQKDGAAFSTSSATWTEMGEPSTPTFATDIRAYMASWSAGGKLYVWGGQTYDDLYAEYVSALPRDGATWDSASNTWTAMPEAGPAGRADPRAVFTGCDAIVYGGSGAAGNLDDGALFRP